MISSEAAAPQFQFVQRVSAVKDADYHLELDEYRNGEDQLLLVHFRVDRWTPSVMKRMLTEWEFFRSVCVTQPLFATGLVDDEKWRRFVSLFGFQPLMPVMTECGQPRSLYVHHGRLNTNHQSIGNDFQLSLGPAAAVPT